MNFVSQQNEALANLPDLIEQKHGALYAEADEKLEGDEEAADDGIASAITLTAETMNRIYEEEGPWLVLLYVGAWSSLVLPAFACCIPSLTVAPVTPTQLCSLVPALPSPSSHVGDAGACAWIEL